MTKLRNQLIQTSGGLYVESIVGPNFKWTYTPKWEEALRVTAKMGEEILETMRQYWPTGIYGMVPDVKPEIVEVMRPRSLFQILGGWWSRARS